MAFKCDKAFIEILDKCANYVDVFLFNLVIEHLKNININKYMIKLVDNKQPLYGPIYVFSLVEIETLKVYIKTYIKIGFIWPYKSLIGIPLLFDKKLDDSLYLCID